MLPSLIPGDKMVNASRMEESYSWCYAVDLAALLTGVYAEFDGLVAAGEDRATDWTGLQEVGLVRQGVPLTELSASVVYAAARRPDHFRVTNEFGDWNTIHHTFTYTNAVGQAMRRARSNLLARGIFDGAMSVYL